MSLPRSLLLVHGAGSGPWVFDGWEASFPGLTVVAVDLQAGLDVAGATLRDYANAVVRAAATCPQPLAVCGWSLGGLVALLAAEQVRPAWLVLLEASPPLEVQGLREVEPATGTFDPERAGGAFPAGMRARRESRRAMAERDRGVSVPSLPRSTRVLAVAGAPYLEERGTRLARLYGAEVLAAGDLSHWDIVRSPALRERVAAWLRSGERVAADEPRETGR